MCTSLAELFGETQRPGPAQEEARLTGYQPERQGWPSAPPPSSQVVFCLLHWHWLQEQVLPGFPPWSIGFLVFPPLQLFGSVQFFSPYGQPVQQLSHGVWEQSRWAGGGGGGLGLRSPVRMSSRHV